MRVKHSCMLPVAFLFIASSGCNTSGESTLVQLGMRKSGHLTAIPEKNKLVAGFGYDHIHDSNIDSVVRGNRQIYIFTEAKETSEIMMCKSWPNPGWPELAAFKPTNDGPKLARPITDKASAMLVLSKVMDAVGGYQLTIDSFNRGKARGDESAMLERMRGNRSIIHAPHKRYHGVVLVEVQGRLRLKSGKDLRYSATIIPSSGRFLSWSASDSSTAKVN